MDESEGVVICEDRHWVHGGTQIYIRMLQCQNTARHFFSIVESFLWCLSNVLEKYEIGWSILEDLFRLHQLAWDLHHTLCHWRQWPNCFWKFGAIRTGSLISMALYFVETIFGFFWPNVLYILCQQICQWTGHIRKILTEFPIISSHT